jgi:hypothetical protein
MVVQLRQLCLRLETEAGFPQGYPPVENGCLRKGDEDLFS